MSVLEVHLDVSDLEQSLAFYTEVLGMGCIATSSAGASVGFACGARLHLRHRPGSGALRDDGGDVYWKIGVTIGDVDLARARLLDRGVAVSEPCQFYDIGYLCHLEDPDGYCIELLQHRFEQNHRPLEPQPDHVLGTPPVIGQLSLNVGNADASLAFYRDIPGMKLLSRQDVPAHGFTLYFLARTSDVPPSADIDAVENREWLWQRQFTTLELRAGESIRPVRAHPPESELGFRGMVLGALDREVDLRDPDGALVRVARRPTSQV